MPEPEPYNEPEPYDEPEPAMTYEVEEVPDAGDGADMADEMVE